MEMENTIQDMENQGVQSYILDLRNNPASSLNPFSSTFVLSCLIYSALVISSVCLINYAGRFSFGWVRCCPDMVRWR